MIPVAGGIDPFGNVYVEGKTTEVVKLQIKGGGRARATVDLAFARAKSVSIIRPDNTVPIPPRSGEASMGMIEPDRYSDDLSVGEGHTRFNNAIVVEFSRLAGNDFGDVDWATRLNGFRFPSAEEVPETVRRYWHWYGSVMPNANGDGGGDLGWNQGEEWLAPDFSTVRPHVDWPYIKRWWGVETIPRDALEAIQNAPPPQRHHLHLRLRDEDSSGVFPWYEFNQTSNYYLTFHNEQEDANIIEQRRLTAPENPWRLFVDKQNRVLQQEGMKEGTSPWQPGSIEMYVEYAHGGTLNCPYAGYNFTANYGQNVVQTVPPKTVKLGETGTVYWRIPLLRYRFTYKHYMNQGRHILGFTSEGMEQEHEGHVDRPPQGLGTYPVSLAVLVRPNDRDFPPLWFEEIE